MKAFQHSKWKIMSHTLGKDIRTNPTEMDVEKCGFFFFKDTVWPHQAIRKISTINVLQFVCSFVLNSRSFPFPQGFKTADLIVYINDNFQMFKLVLEKAKEPEIKLPISAGSSKKQESSRKISTSALLTMPKPLTVWVTINCGKFFNRWEYQTT